MYLLLFLFGVAASGQSLSFGLVKDQSHPKVVGTAIGFNNMAVVAGGALFQPLTGILLDFNWKGEIANGIPIYTAANYRWAFLVLPICYFVGVIVSSFFLKETHCQSKHDDSLANDTFFVSQENDVTKTELATDTQTPIGVMARSSIGTVGDS